MTTSRVALKDVWIARLGAVVVRLLGLTWRLHWVNARIRDDARERGQPVIYALWHGQLLPLLWAHRDRGIAVMISEHRDGELIARVALSLGYRVIRGSTTRGAARALLGACRELEAGHDVAVTPDGPRGPAQSVAPGAAVIAERSGAPLLPVAAVSRRVWRLRSWDRFQVPKPFARVAIAYSPLVPIRVGAIREAEDQAGRVRDAIDAAEHLAANA